VENTESLGISAGQPKKSAELVKQLRKESRQKFLAGIRDSLGSVVHQLAFSPAEAAIICGKSPTWAYRKIYSGEFRVINAEDGRLSIPRAEIERYLGGAKKYNPEPRRRSGVVGMDVPRNDEPRREPGRHQKLLPIEYGLLSFLSTVTGSIFWWSEQRGWQIANRLEELEVQR